MLGRLRRGRRPDPATLLDSIRQTIVALDEQRRASATAAAQALVSQAEVGRLCGAQLAALSRAYQQADDATVDADRAAAWARADGSPDAADHEQTAAALRASQDVLGAAAEPIHALLAEAGGNVERARAVLAQSRTVLDDQIREQIRALRVFEAAENRRLVEQARRAARD